jgi:hypothetical protein
MPIVMAAVKCYDYMMPMVNDENISVEYFLNVSV